MIKHVTIKKNNNIPNGGVFVRYESGKTASFSFNKMPESVIDWIVKPEVKAFEDEALAYYYTNA